jgi:hypothetical protein
MLISHSLEVTLTIRLDDDLLQFLTALVGIPELKQAAAAQKAKAEALKSAIQQQEK